MECRLAIETVSRPAAKDVTKNEAVAISDITEDIIGTESVDIFKTLHQKITRKFKGINPLGLRCCNTIKLIQEKRVRILTVPYL